MTIEDRVGVERLDQPPRRVELRAFRFEFTLERRRPQRGARPVETAARQRQPALQPAIEPLAEMGARAVVELEAMIDGREPQDVVIDIPPKLIYRESVAGPPKG